MRLMARDDSLHDADPWDETPRGRRRCPGCQQLERELLALQTELRWRTDQYNHAVLALRRLEDAAIIAAMPEGKK